MPKSEETLILRVVVGIAIAIVVIACVAPGAGLRKGIAEEEASTEEVSWWRRCVERMVTGNFFRKNPMIVPCRVANLNIGGRFANVMEFVSFDPSWSRVYESMLSVLDETVPACAEVSESGQVWRDIYKDLHQAAGLDLIAENRPSALRGRQNYWYAKDDCADAESYIKRWESEVSTGSQGSAARKQLRALDLMFETALCSAFNDRNEFNEFEIQFPYITRNWLGWQRKLELLLVPLLEKKCQVIGLQEALWRGEKDAAIDPKRQAELLLDIVNSKSFLTYSLAAKPSAELIILWSIEENAKPQVVILEENDDVVVSKSVSFKKKKATKTQQLTVHSLQEKLKARDPFDEPSLVGLEPATKRKAAKSIDTTRRRTLIVDLGHYCVAVVHAREHRGCAQVLAHYFADVANILKKPTIILSDTNLEAADDVSAFSKILNTLNLAESTPLLDTTFKQRTVFQAQTHKAFVPPPPRPFVDAPSSMDDVFAADRLARSSAKASSIAQDIADAAQPTPQHLVVAPKDRILCSTDACLLVSRTLFPERLASVATTSRLPTPDWPSDHLACIANILLVQKDSVPQSNSRVDGGE